MAIDFSALKANRGQNVAALQRSLEKTEGSSYEDPRVWKYSRSEKNISMNVIRLLPIPLVDMQAAEEGRFNKEDLTPMLKLLRHNFKAPKGYLNILSPQTLSQPDPISEWSRPQWAAIKGKDPKTDPIVAAERERLKEFIPKSEFYANIYIINDAQKPEFNGQVKLFKFGEAFRKFVDTASEPKFPTDPKFDPFCPWTGANIELNLSFEARKFKGKDTFVPKWDAVKWVNIGQPLGTDEFIEEVWGKQFSLLEFVEGTKVPTYDELKAKFCKVMGLDENFAPTAPGSSIGRTAGEFLENKPATTPAPSAPATAAPAQASAPAPSAPAADTDELAELEALLNS